MLAIDSTVLPLHRALASTFAGCRTNSAKAAAKLHVVMNVAGAGARRVRLTSERVHDVVPWRRVGTWVRDRLLLFDLGDSRFRLFREAPDPNRHRRDRSWTAPPGLAVA